MQTVAEVRLDAKSGLESLCALRHKTRQYACRQYTAKGASSCDVVLRAEGSRTPMKCWDRRAERASESERGVVVYEQMTHPAAYVDYSTAVMTYEGPVRDIYITHKLFLRADEKMGSVTAHLTVDSDLQHQVAVLRDACISADIAYGGPGDLVSIIRETCEQQSVSGET